MVVVNQASKSHRGQENEEVDDSSSQEVSYAVSMKRPPIKILRPSILVEDNEVVGVIKRLSSTSSDVVGLQVYALWRQSS